MGNDKDVEFFIILYSRIINLQPNPHPNHKIMTTNANQNIESNKVNPNEKAGNESSFEFKGFPYVISILGEDYNVNQNGCSVDVKSIEKKIKGYIDKIAEKCTWGIWYWKKSVIPLFILFDANNKFIKEILEEKQKEYHDNNRKDRDIVLVAVAANKPENGYDKYKNIISYNDPKINSEKSTPELERYYWIDPKFDDLDEKSPDEKKLQDEAPDKEPGISKEKSPDEKKRKQRLLNEFIVQHSHLAIIFNKKLYTEAVNDAPDDSLIWAIRYKLEGYPGSRYQQEQTEKITYPAIGPVLRIVITKDKNNKDKNNIDTYFYPSREPITKQDGNKPEEFKPRDLNLDYIDSCKIKNNKDFTEEQEIKDNLEILKIVNRKSLKHTNQKQEENKKYHIKDLALRDYGISKFDNPNSLVQRLIVYSKAIQKVSDHYQWWTSFVTQAFCLLFLFALACNSSLICINDILITQYGVNIFQIWGWWTPPVNIQKGLNIAGIEYFTKPSIYIFGTLAFLCIGIFFCCLYSILGIPHQKYHRFQTLADCLRIQAFWKFAGMDDNVSANFRSHQIPKTDWLMITLNGLNIITKGKEEEFSENNIKLIDKFWLEDRIDHEFVPIYKKTPFKVVIDSLSRIDIFFIVLYSCIFLCSLVCFIATVPFLYKIILLGVAIIVIVSARLLIKNGFYPQFITVVSLSLVLYGCFTGIFELWRLSTLCDGAQTHNQINVKFLMTETFRLCVQLLASFILVAFLYLRMQMFDKERRRIEQLRSSFNVADYSLDIILNPEDKNIANKIASKKIKHDKEVANKALKEILKENSFLFNEEDIYLIFRNEYFDNNFIDKLLEKYNIQNNSEYEQEPQERSWFQWAKFLWKVFRGKDRDDKRINTKDNDKTDSLKNEIQKALEFYNEKQKKQLYELIKLVKKKNDNFNKSKNSVLDDEALNNNAEENAKKEFCQLILLELGQEVLSKRINWLLDVNDRDLKKPQ